MAILKRATKKLVAAGHPTLQVRGGLYGYYCVDTRYKSQSWPACRETPQEVVDDVLRDGVLPQESKAAVQEGQHDPASS